MSFCTSPIDAANTAVSAPMMATVFMAVGASTNTAFERATMYTPAVTMVAAWIKRRNRRGAFHRIGQPDIERKLRGLAAGSDEQQQRGGGQHGIADGEVSAADERVDVGEAERTEIPDQRERAENESGIADAIHDECLVGRGRRGVAMKVKTDQQIRAQANAFPSHEQQHVVIRQDEREHGKHEQVHVSEEAVVAAFVRHVSGGVDVDQHAHAGDEEQPDGRERIEQESGVDVEGGGRAVFLREGQMAVAGAQPGINNLLKGLAGAMGEVRVLDDRKAGKEERKRRPRRRRPR